MQCIITGGQRWVITLLGCLAVQGTQGGQTRTDYGSLKQTGGRQGSSCHQSSSPISPPSLLYLLLSLLSHHSVSLTSTLSLSLYFLHLTPKQIVGLWLHFHKNTCISDRLDIFFPFWPTPHGIHMPKKAAGGPVTSKTCHHPRQTRRQ